MKPKQTIAESIMNSIIWGKKNHPRNQVEGDDGQEEPEPETPEEENIPVEYEEAISNFSDGDFAQVPVRMQIRTCRVCGNDVYKLEGASDLCGRCS